MGRAYTTSDLSVAAFREACAQATSLPALERLFLDNVSALGFKFATLCNRTHLTRPAAGTVVLSNLPSKWVEHHVANGFHHISPTLTAAERGVAPFFWTDAEFRAALSTDQMRVLNEARDFGLKCGFSFPILTPGRRVAVCSLSAETFSGIDYAACALGGLLGMYTYERAQALLTVSSSSHLSRRERQCLALVAEGKSDWAIGQILQLSHSTVHNTLERAKARLGVASRIQAVVRALQLGEIVLDEPAGGGVPAYAPSEAHQ